MNDALRRGAWDKGSTIPLSSSLLDICAKNIFFFSSWNQAAVVWKGWECLVPHPAAVAELGRNQGVNQVSIRLIFYLNQLEETFLICKVTNDKLRNFLVI